MMFYSHIEKIRPRPGGPDQYFCSGCGLIVHLTARSLNNVLIQQLVHSTSCSFNNLLIQQRTHSAILRALSHFTRPSTILRGPQSFYKAPSHLLGALKHVTGHLAILQSPWQVYGVLGNFTGPR